MALLQHSVAVRLGLVPGTASDCVHQTGHDGGRMPFPGRDAGIQMTESGFQQGLPDVGAGAQARRHDRSKVFAHGSRSPLWF